MIEIKNVNFQYKGAKEGLLNDFSLTISEGEVVLLSGSSGCGKTTVLRLINGLIPHYYKGELSGSVFVDGKNMSEVELCDLAGTVGTVFQNPRSQFFSTETDGEITFGAENIGMNPKEIIERKNKIVEEMKIKKLLGRSIFELSGGEKQIIACASISVLSPKIIVLDEPSSNLDIETIERLKEIISLWKSQGKTIIVAEHRLYYMRDLADRMIIIENGEIKKEFHKEEIKNLTIEDTKDLGLRPLSLKDIEFSNSYDLEAKEYLEFNNFKFSYKRSMHGIAIDNLNVPSNAVIAVIGHNGAGKSTFVRNICGLEGRCKGTMQMENKKLKARKRLKNCYMIMQDVNHQLFTSSVEEEVELSIENKKMTEEMKKKACQEILNNLDLNEFSEKHPMALSGGQKQRTAIASGIASSKPIIILDEPTSGLDYAHMKLVAEEIEKLHNIGKTIFIVTHDLEFILSCCNYIVHLEAGRIIDNYSLNKESFNKLKEFFINQ